MVKENDSTYKKEDSIEETDKIIDEIESKNKTFIEREMDALQRIEKSISGLSLLL